MAKINAFHVSLFADFLEKMRGTSDGDGTLLDHSLLLYGSGNGKQHRPPSTSALIVSPAGVGAPRALHIPSEESGRLGTLH